MTDYKSFSEGMKMTGFLARLAVVFAAFFAGGNAASAQDNAACDAACPVPCYFGSCSPAKATYERALENCDLRSLESVAQLYNGTVAATQAAKALAKLRSLGYSMSGISATPNTGGQSCAALVDGTGGGGGNGTNDPCANAILPPGFRCTVQNGAVVVVQDAAVAPPPVAVSPPVPSFSSGIGPRPAGGEAASEYDKCIGGEARACTQLGYLYRKGRSGLTQNDARTVALYRRGCDGGNGQGCTNLGFLYRNGNAGLAQDEAQAATLYRRGCDNGNAHGCSNLGFMYEGGRGGLAQNHPFAVTMYRQACDDNYALACSNLGNMYEHAKGVPKDLTRARELYKQGCDAGNKRGCDLLEKLQ